MSADLNAVFSEAFVEALWPLVQRIDELAQQLDVLEDVVASFSGQVEQDLQASRAYQHEFGDNRADEALPSVCGATPPTDDLFPGQRWSPCDLPFGHADGDDPTAHNCGLVM